MDAIYKLTIIGGIGLLALAMWPGGIEIVFFIFPCACLLLPFLGFWFLLLVILALVDLAERLNAPEKRKCLGLRSAGIMFATLGLLWLQVPQRIAFFPLHGVFQHLADEAQSGQETTKEFWVGHYFILEYQADERGGVYFCTGVGPDGIGPDRMYYGFAFQPNSKGTPFGNAHYRYFHLFGDWCSFRVSNDY